MSESFALEDGTRISFGSSRKQWTIAQHIDPEIKIDTGGLYVWFVFKLKETKRRKNKPLRRRAFSFWLSDINNDPAKQTPRLIRNKAVFWIRTLKKDVKLTVYRNKSETTGLAA